MKIRVAATVAIAIALLMAAHTALTGRAASDIQTGSTAEENARPVGGPQLQEARPECVQASAPITGESVIDVPSFCIGSPCQIMLWDDAVAGAFGPGLHMPVYYTQSPTDDAWIGGPNLDLAGVSFSGGGGTNGDTVSDTIFGGAWTSAGNLYSLYDDWETEDSPTQWTIRFEGNTILEEPPVFYVCPLPSDDLFERFDVSTAGLTTVTVPGFCLDDVCGILMWNDAGMGAFGAGIRWPVHYAQDSDDGSWIGGPNSAIGGSEHSEGAGVNGDGITNTIFIGGDTIPGDDLGGYVRLHDDSVLETSPDQWTIEFVPDSQLTQASYFVYNLFCDYYPITRTGSTTMTMPAGCIDGMCTVLLWNDAELGALSPFGPGIQLPVYYSQSPTDATWIGGPNLHIAGYSFSQGGGTNGNYYAEAIFQGGQTPSGGYWDLRDDGGEYSPLQWTAYFSPDSYVSVAAYFVCPETCVQFDVPVPIISHRVWLPLVQREYSP
jgi:hypothetical protein